MSRWPGKIRHPNNNRAYSTLFLLAACTMIAGSLPVYAQIFKVGGGTSTVINAHGATLELTANDYQGWFSFGYLNGYRTGAHFQTRFRDYTLGLGDETVQFDLPTDVFGGRSYFQGRGVSLSKDYENIRFFSFVGAAAREYPTAFFRGSRAENGVGAFFLDAKIKPNLHYFSRNAFAGKMTSINGLRWEPRLGLKTAVAAGMGGSDPYFSTSVELEREKISARASYVAAGSQFRRLAKVPFASPEADGGNFDVSYRPRRNLSFSVGHSNIILPRPTAGLLPRATFNRYSASWRVAGYGLSGSLFDSRTNGGRGRSHSLTLRKKIHRRVDASASYLTSRPSAGAHFSTFVTSINEKINTRLSLQQYLTRTNGRTNISYGGRFESNIITVGVGYSTFYIPFARGNHFQHAATFSVRFRPFGSYQIGAQTLITPTGQTLYSVTGSTYFYHGDYNGHATGRQTFRMPKYIYLGRVIDEERRPVEAAAILIGETRVFTDTQGRFFLRTGERETVRLAVLLEQFLLPGDYTPVYTPASITPEEDEDSEGVTIILRRVRPPSR